MKTHIGLLLVIGVFSVGCGPRSGSDGLTNDVLLMGALIESQRVYQAGTWLDENSNGVGEYVGLDRLLGIEGPKLDDAMFPLRAVIEKGISIDFSTDDEVSYQHIRLHDDRLLVVALAAGDNQRAFHYRERYFGAVLVSNIKFGGRILVLGANETGRVYKRLAEHEEIGGALDQVWWRIWYGGSKGAVQNSGSDIRRRERSSEW